jgi:hypothetical protein
MEVMRWAKVDLEKLRAEIGTRVVPANDRVLQGALPLGAAAQEVMDAAIALVRQRKGEVVNALHVLRALSDADDGFLPALLARCGSSVAKVRERLTESVL